MDKATTAVKQVMGPVEWVLLLVLALLWGGSFFFSKIAVGELPPLTVVLCRVALAALALNVVVVLSGRRMPADPRLWGAFFVMGLLNNVIPFSLIFWGQTQIASGLAAILNATTPLFTVLVAHVATKDEKLSASRLLGVLAGVVGVAVMIGPGAFAGGGGSTLAKIAVLGAALSYAFAAIWGRRFRGLPPVITATGQLSASALVMTPVALLVDRPWSLAFPSPRVVWALIALALLSTAAGYIVYFALLATGRRDQRLAGDAPHPAECAAAGRPLPGGVGGAARSGRSRVHRRRVGGDRRPPPSAGCADGRVAEVR